MAEPKGTEAERRLERLEQEIRRRKCDSTIMVMGAREPAVAGWVAAANQRGGREAPAEPAGPDLDDPGLIGRLAHRLDRLERRSTQLEDEVHAFKRRGRRVERIVLGVLVGSSLVAGVTWVTAVVFL